MKSLPSPWRRVLERGALWGAVGFSAAALIGFAIFGVHPRLLAHVPWSAPIFALSFRLFSLGQILVAAGALFVLLMLRARWRWLPALIAVYVLSLSSELSGTAVGFPFGPYYYTDLLGPKWFDLVPLVIPLSWFMMAVPSYFLARWAAPAGGSAIHVVLGVLILTLWDLALDPAMSHATPYWTWEVEGIYYGMPLVNLAGWLFTSALIMIALVLLRSGQWVDGLPFRWMTVFYAANVILPLGMTAAAGLWWGVAVTLAAYGLLAVGIKGGETVGLWRVGASRAGLVPTQSAVHGSGGGPAEDRARAKAAPAGEMVRSRPDAVQER